jgi:hypothetical protein
MKRLKPLSIKLACTVASLIGLSVLNLAPARAQYEFKRPHFTGTDAADAEHWWYFPAGTPLERSFTRFTIWISGTLANGKRERAKVWEREYAPVYQVRKITFTPHFDSTRYKSGSVITVETEVVTDEGVISNSKTTARARNRAMTMFHPDFEVDNGNSRTFQSKSIMQMMQSSGFEVFYSNKQNTTQTQFLSRLKDYNVLYVDSHGLQAQFQTPDSEITNTNHIHPALKPGNDRRPTVLYNFVFVISCSFLGVDGVEDDDAPKTFGVENNAVNRSVLGFADTVSGIEKNSKWVAKVFTNLLDREYSIGEAVDSATKYYHPEGEQFYQDPTPLNIITKQLVRIPIEPIIFGDRKMTLHGLYRIPRGLVPWVHIETSITGGIPFG